jgi:DDE superfamily endonuclease
MITSESLRQHPAACRSFTGHTPEQFETVFAQFLPAHRQRCAAAPTTKEGKPRQRAFGGGCHSWHDPRTRLLIALIWLRIYPTFEVLGLLFSLNKTNVHEAVMDQLATLERLADFPFERPTAERKKLRSLAAVRDAFPDVRGVIDAKEQRIQRPKSRKEDDRQKPDYSGKKKCPTLKNEIAVQPDGTIGAVSARVPGGAVHDLTLQRQTRLVAPLDPGDEAAMVDQGYDGLGNDYPHQGIYQPFKARRNRPLTAEQKAYHHPLSRYRIVVEHTNAPLNQFQVLSQLYRHARTRHSRVVRAGAFLGDQRIRQRPLKSDPVA